MIDTTPMLSLQTFVISFILLLFLARCLTEYYIYKQKSSHDVYETPHEQDKNLSQNYYNTKRKIN